MQGTFEANRSAAPAAGAPTHLSTRWEETRDDGTSEKEAVLAALRKEGAAGDTPTDLRHINLIGQDLSGVDLSRCDLSYAELSQADLSGARLMGAVLDGAVLHEAKLNGAEFMGASLKGADLGAADAERCGFARADLERANLFGAKLRDATLQDAKLGGVDARTAELAGARLCRADLAHANFARALMPGADLEGANILSTSFLEADLRGTRLKALQHYATANFIRADIREVDFSGAYLVRRYIMDENYLDEFRHQSTANRVVYWLWWATSDCGRSLARWGLLVLALTVGFGALYQMVEVDYGDYPTWLSPYYYSLVTLTTLGYGDVLPGSVAAQVVAMSEVVLGYFMLGGMLSIFSNKMARRAD